MINTSPSRAVRVPKRLPELLEPLLDLRSDADFDEASIPELVALAHHTERVEVRAGSTFLPEDEPLVAHYRVLHGRIFVESKLAPAPIRLGPGERVGFLELLAGHDMAVSATAEEDTLLYRVRWDAQLELWERHFGLLLATLRVVTRESLGVRPESEPTTDASPFFASGTPEHRATKHDTVEKLLALYATPSLPSTNTDALSELAAVARWIEVDPGEIVREAAADPPDSFLTIVSGHAMMEGGAAVHAPETLHLGEMIATVSSPETVVAKSQVRGLHVDREAFVDVLEDHFEMGLELAAAAARRIVGVPDSATIDSSDAPQEDP